MEDRTKRTWGVSISALIVFALFSIYRQHQEQDTRNKEMQRQYKMQESFKDAEKSIESFKPYMEPYYDLHDSSSCALNPIEINKEYKINVKIAYPCRWKKLDIVKNTPSLVAQYANMITDTTMAAISISVNDYSENITDEQIDKFRTVGFLKKATTNRGHTFISFKKIEIDKVKGDEVLAMYSHKEGTNYFRTDHLYYGQIILTITYFVTCTSEKGALNLYNQYTPLFDILRENTQFR